MTRRPEKLRPVQTLRRIYNQIREANLRLGLGDEEVPRFYEPIGDQVHNSGIRVYEILDVIDEEIIILSGGAMMASWERDIISRENSKLKEEFGEMRRCVQQHYRDPVALDKEIREMRERILYLEQENEKLKKGQQPDSQNKKKE